MCPARGSAHCLHCAASKQAWRHKPRGLQGAALTDQPLPRWSSLAEFARKMAATMPLFYSGSVTTDWGGGCEGRLDPSQLKQVLNREEELVVVERNDCNIK